jgi:hypothetical protein
MPRVPRGRPAAPSDTPLARWLDAKGMTRRAFAIRCTTAAGRPIDHRVVERWARGDVVPSASSRTVIARATRGDVPVSVWDRLAATG